MSYFAAHAVFADIIDERLRQDELWGKDRELEPLVWVSILTEEVGEVAKAALDKHFDGEDGHCFKDELIQVAAVCVAALEQIYKKENKEKEES